MTEAAPRPGGNKAGGLNLNLNLKKDLKRSKLPAKRSINLAEVGIEKMNTKAAVPGVILVLALAVAFGKFGVADRLTAMSLAQSEAADAQARLSAAYNELQQYDDIDNVYAHYTFSGMTDEELIRVPRDQVIGLIERIIMPESMTSSWVVNENILTLTVTGETLQDINLLVGQLEGDPLVSYCTVTTATMDEKRYTDGYIRNIFGEIIAVEEADPTPEVRANIVIFLQNPTEEEAAEK